MSTLKTTPYASSESRGSFTGHLTSKHDSRAWTPSLYRRYFGSTSNASLQGSLLQEGHHHARLGEYAARLWEDKDLTDVMIVVQTQEFKAHKAVLACYSPYFKEVLLQPGANNIHYVEIPCVTAKAFGILLHFMYTGEMQLTCQDLADVYRAGRRLGMTDALCKCLELLTVSQNHIENTIHLYVTSKKLNLHEPTVKAFKLMCKHFETVIDSLEFLDLSVDQIIEFFNANELGARSEIMVYIAALNWINYKFLERETCISRIIQAVRFPMMTLEEIVYCYHPPILPGILLYQSVKDEILKGTAYVAAKQFGQEHLFKEMSCPKRTYLLAGEPFVLWNSESLYIPERYEEFKVLDAATKIQSWYRGHSVRRATESILDRRLSAAVTIQSVFRGFKTRKMFRKILEEHRKKLKDQLTYDKGNIAWHTPVPEVEFLPKTDSAHFIGIRPEFRHIIYVIGGIDVEREHPVTNTILSYDTTKAGEWKELTNLPEPRHDPKMVFFGNELFIIGGCILRDREGKRMVPKPECFRYNLTSETWVPMSPMSIGRVFHGVAVLNSYIYVLGGKSEHSRVLASAECYDPATDTWMEVKDMSMPRMGMGAVSFAEKVWVAGGMTSNGKKLLLVDDVEAFYPSAFRWIKRTRLPHTTAFMSLVHAKDELYCIGGAIQPAANMQDMLSLSKIYRYDLRNNYWKSFANLPMPLHSVSAVGLGPNIYVLGGYCSQQKAILKEVFYYDTEARKWRPSSCVPSAAAEYVLAAATAEACS